MIVEKLLVAAIAIAASGQVPDPDNREFPRLSGPYPGQKPPGLEPDQFAPGILRWRCREPRRW